MTEPGTLKAESRHKGRAPLSELAVKAAIENCMAGWLSDSCYDLQEINFVSEPDTTALLAIEMKRELAIIMLIVALIAEMAQLLFSWISFPTDSVRVSYGNNFLWYLLHHVVPFVIVTVILFFVVCRFLKITSALKKNRSQIIILLGIAFSGELVTLAITWLTAPKFLFSWWYEHNFLIYTAYHILPMLLGWIILLIVLYLAKPNFLSGEIN